MSNKVLLIFPGKYGTKDANMPLSLLFIAKPLIEHGFDVVIRDCRLHDYHEFLADEYLCVGLTVYSGAMIKHALEVSRYSKKVHPLTPVVWGGPHPTVRPHEVMQEYSVDAVVVGEGENKFLNIVHCARRGSSATGGLFVSTHPIDIDTTAHLPYHLLDFENDYANARDKFELVTSKGCPHSCRFCSAEVQYGRTWRAKTPETVLSEIDYITDTYHPRRIAFQDPNFFVSVERVKQICKAIVERKLDVELSGMVRCDMISKVLPQVLNVMYEAGFRELAVGAESGSDRILKHIEKGVNTRQIMAAIKRMRRYEFTPIVSFMMAFPDETETDLEQTLSLYDEIKREHPGAMINGMFPYTPYPGTDLAAEYKCKFPDTLDGWAEYEFGNMQYADWLTAKQKRRFTAISICVRVMFVNQLLDKWTEGEAVVRLGSTWSQFLGRVFCRFFACVVRFRWRYRLFGWPLDLWVWRAVYTRVKGQPV